MRNPSPHTGMTLWETLGVLALLLAVTALLWPDLRPDHERRYRTGCQSDMKQLGLTLIQYEQDADEQTPPGVNGVGNGWAGQIYSFVKSTDVYHCPDDRQKGCYVSYAENRNTAKQPQTAFADPAKTVQLYETTTLNCDPSTTEPVSATGLSAPQDSTRHSEQDFGLNFLAEDGHVRYLKPGRASSGPNAARPNQIGVFALTFAVK